MKLATIAVLCASFGCADVYKAYAKLTQGPPTFDNRSQYPDGLFYQVWGELERLAQVDIAERGITAIAYEDVRQFEDQCPDVTEGLGCSDPSHVHIYAGVGTDFLDVGTATAHQLGHLYLYQRSGGSHGDGRHALAEWWDPEVGYVAGIRDLIAAGDIQ